MKTFILSALAATALLNTARADFQYAKSVPAEQKKLLTQDMFFLANQPYQADAKLMQLMGIGASDGLTILNWVDNRVNHIVPEDFKLEENIYVVNENFYPQPAELPKLPTSAKNPEDDNNSGGSGGDGGGDDSGKVQTVMSNVGGAIYLSGKMGHSMLGFKVDDKKIEVTSPRIGILKVGSGLFATEDLIGLPADTAMARYFRLMTLVHEARHSDGRGESAGFLHAICTSGRLEGYAACDANSNGPYTIEGQFVKVAAKNCKTCRPEEIEMLNTLAADSFGRIAAPAAQSLDAEASASIISSYQLLLSFCQKTPGSCSGEKIKSYQDAIAAAQGKPAAAAPPVWDI